jgi:hypothetical protein
MKTDKNDPVSAAYAALAFARDAGGTDTSDAGASLRDPTTL